MSESVSLELHRAVVAQHEQATAALAERVQALEAALDAKTDEAATLRAVIEQVTWEHNCPWCGESHGKHAPDCQRQAALAQTAQEVKQ